MSAGTPADVFVHDRALVETDLIAAGTRIWAFAHVMRDARIGAAASNLGVLLEQQGTSTVRSPPTVERTSAVMRMAPSTSVCCLRNLVTHPEPTLRIGEHWSVAKGKSLTIVAASYCPNHDESNRTAI
jgi:hypothetical protein